MHRKSGGYWLWPINHWFRLSIVFFFVCRLTFAEASRISFIPVEPEILSNSFVRCFYRDSKGYMWLGTADGLFRYDGTHAYRYDHNPEQSSSLCHNYINAIVEDSGNRLWLGTAQGVCIYDREKDNFVTLDSIHGIRNQLNNRYITALSFDHEGHLWIGTHGGGVSVFDPTSMQFTYLTDGQGDAESAGANYVNTLLRTEDVMWCGTKGGLKLYSTKNMQLLPMKFGGESLPDTQVSQLLADNAGNVWLASVNGDVLKIIPRNGYYTFQRVITGESVGSTNGSRILTICKDGRGNLWIGGENSGLNYFDIKTGMITRYRSDDSDAGKLPTNSIRSVYIDDTGLIWIGTFNKGAYLIDNVSRKFADHKIYKGIDDNFKGRNVRSFAEDRAGNIWIVVDEIGLGKLDSKTKVLEPVNALNKQLPDKYLTAVICDRKGDLWIGSAGNGVYRIDLNSFTMKNYFLQSEGFGNNKISCLYEDRNGTIWAGTFGSGLFYFDPHACTFKVLYDMNTHDHIRQTAYISSMVEDSDGIFWVATMYGLYALTRKGNSSFDYDLYLPNDRPGSISSSGIQTVYEDKNKKLWVGTTDNGLNQKSKGDSVFRLFRHKDGFASNTVRAIVSDAAGNLWISSNMGLSKFDPAKNSCANYTRDDGLPSNNFYGNACFRSSTGELFFGGNNGFIVFYPDSILCNTAKPVVYLTDLRINNQSVEIGVPGSPLEKHISLTTSLELSYDQRSFVIDFATLDPGRLFKSDYCYKLEGFDKEWNCVGANHSATYTNMDPGSYVFWVKASNGEGTWSETPARLEITIHPLIWKTWWAMMIYLLIFAALAYFLMRVRAERMKMKHQLMLERLAREREHELSESKTHFFTNISHEFRTPLSLILMPLESLIAEEQVPALAKEKISSAYRNADKMMHLVNELMDFNKIESGNLKLDLQYGELVGRIKDIASLFEDLADKRNIRFSIKEHVPLLTGWFDHDKLEKILVNLLSNAFKFTRDNGEITIIINEKKRMMSQRKIMTRCLELEVFDNGMGISKEEIPHIFDKFYQAKSALKIPNPGTGIGLSWTKALVELHQGYITAESIPDQETRFRIVIPIDADVFELEDSVEHFVATTIPKAANQNKSQPPGSDDKSDILIVEDNNELRNYLTRELQSQFNVLEAQDGLQGLEIALDQVPDLIISDILMPNKTGIEFCQAIKADIKTSHIPFILLTAKASLDDQISGIEMGADIYITKPFSIRYLLSHVRHLINSRHKLYAHFSQDVYLFPGNNEATKIEREFLQQIIDHIIEHIQDTQLGVDSLAELFNLSRVQVYRKIKALTGKTAVEFIRSVRLKQSIKLMETKKYTLSEVAYRSGFNSASYFTRAFKEEYGKAPSEYLGISG